MGERFVFDYVEKIVRNCKLQIYGNLLSEEVIFYFLDEYEQYRKKQKESYELDDVLQKLESYLEDITVRHSGDYDLSSVQFESFTGSSIISISGHAKPLSFSYSYISSYEIREAIKYIRSKDVETVNRPYPRPEDGDGLVRKGNWIWSKFTQESENKRIHRILSSSLDEYREFVNGNRLRFPESPYLDKETSIVYLYRSANEEEEPSLAIYFIKEQAALPKLSVYVNPEEKYICNDFTSGDLIINGTRYNFSSFIGTAAYFLFDDRPAQKFIYNMLFNDLEDHYENLEGLGGDW